MRSIMSLKNDRFNVGSRKNPGSPIKGFVKRKNTPLFKKTYFFWLVIYSACDSKLNSRLFTNLSTLYLLQLSLVFLPVPRPLFLYYRFTFSIFWSASVTHQVQGNCVLSARRQNTAPGPLGPQKFIGAIPCSIGWVTKLVVISQPHMDSRHRRIRI